MADREWIKSGADKLTFGERLDDLIKKAGIDQSKLSAATGISQSAISEYINGKKGGTEHRAPDCAAVIAFAQYFSVSTDYLLGQTQYKTQDTGIKSICEYTGLSESAIKAILRETAQDDTRRVLNIILGFDPASFHRMVRYANLGITIGEKYKNKSINWESIPHEIRAELFECLGINPEGLDYTIDHTRERYFTGAKNSLHTVLLSWLASPDGKPLLYEDDTMEGSGTDGND